MKKSQDKVLVYIAGSMPNVREDVFLDNLGKAYVLRNAQFFRDKEDSYPEVYNLAGSKYVDEAYGDKVVQSGLGKEKAETKAKDEPVEAKEEAKEEVSAPKPARGRKSTPKGE